MDYTGNQCCACNNRNKTNCNMNNRTNDMNYGMNSGINREMNCGMNNARNMSNRNMYSSRANMEKHCNCGSGCDRGDMPVDDMVIGMCYVPWQKWQDIYDMEKGFECGTIFEELDKPYLGRPVK